MIPFLFYEKTPIYMSLTRNVTVILKDMALARKLRGY
jgi:hypothetical protein